MVKKIVGLMLVLIMAVPTFAGCSIFGNTTVLKIMNWADYFDETLLEDFENYYFDVTGKKVSVLYETIDKPESMAIKIEKGKESWDLMCPSEAVLERLLKQNLLLPINTSMENMPNYNTYVSEYIKERSDAVEDSAKNAIRKMATADPEKYKDYGFDKWDEKAFDADYSVAYMWGNFGIMYNIEKIGDSDILNSWEALWDTDDFKNQMTMKNGPRETFAIGMIYVYREPLMILYNKYLDSNDESDLDIYKAFLADIYQISGVETSYIIDGKTYPVYRGENLIMHVETALVDQKQAGVSYEMDDGKDEMIRGRFAMGMAWNGDAVWAMFESDLLDFIIPLEGSNFWVDSWVIPKYTKNQDIAEMFIDFICSPDSAIRNMDYVGYTSAIQGNDVLSWAVLYGGNFDDPFDVSLFFDNIDFDGTDANGGWFYLFDEDERQIYKDSEDIDEYTVLAYIGDDGKYYDFETDELTEKQTGFYEYKVYVEHAFVNSIMYPSKEDLDRCGIMLGYSDYSDEILQMWARVKGNKVPLYVIICLSIVLAGAVFLIIFNIVKNKKFNKIIKTTKH